MHLFNAISVFKINIVCPTTWRPLRVLSSDIYSYNFYTFPEINSIRKLSDLTSYILTPKYYVGTQTIVLDQCSNFVDFEKCLAFPTLFLRWIWHGWPSICTAVRHLSILPKYGTRVCSVWTHSENCIITVLIFNL